ncbi:SLOG family protein [Streptomyces sp. NPDC002248]
MSALRVIVTGSRNWSAEHIVHTKLDEAVGRAAPLPIILVQGGCSEGPDNFSHRWFLRTQVANPSAVADEEIWEADWSQGLSGGFRRNEHMVRAGAWGVLGFVAPCIKPGCTRNGGKPHGSHGTMHCLKVARHYNLPIRAWKRGW